MNKLILEFEEDYLNIEKVLIFNNEKDAIEYLNSKKFVDIQFYDGYFTFNESGIYHGRGKLMWAKLH